MTGTVRGLHVNPEGGVPKHPVEHLIVGYEGCQGDKQNDRKHHGGPQRAVCLMETWVLKRLQDEGHPIHPGSTGENMLIDGTQPGELCVGARLVVGSVVLELTCDAPPCRTIQASFTEGSFRNLSHKRVSGQTRWYARVVEPGTVRLNDDVRVLSATEPTGSQ